LRSERPTAGLTAAPGSVPPAARCAGVVKIYRTATGEVHALKGVDATFPSGQITAVTGPSGSGKSSLLRILAALDRPTGGSVSIVGTETVGLPAGRLSRLRRQRVGYVFQRPGDNLVPYLTAAEHVRQAAHLRGADAEAGLDLLDRLGLGHRHRHHPGQLSGGEQQRLAFAQAVVGGPALVVADEPTAELDSRSGGLLLEAVADLASTGIAFVVATHDPVVARAAPGTIALRHGAVEAEIRADRTLSVIDDAGRVQLPPEALALFPEHRAVLRIVDGEIRMAPPGTHQRDEGGGAP
jgi:putative ABC transport system ATP-binding protein